MAQADYQFRSVGAPPVVRENTVARSGWMRTGWFRLLAILFLIELLLPVVLWKAGLPRPADFVKEIVAGGILLVTFVFMLLRNRIPGMLLLVLGLTLIWGLTSLLDGESLAAFAWGWWRFFKYPLLALFAFTVPRWPKDFAGWFIKFLLVVLAFEVAAQFVQFVLGEPPGDSLAGTFGLKGVGPFTMFVFFVVCVALGKWVATGDWKTLVLTLALGAVASMLNVTKFYLLALVPLGLAALGLHMIRGGRFRQLFVYVTLFLLAGAVLVPVYNRFIADTRGLAPLQEYIQPENIENYLFNDGKGNVDGRYNLGRGLSLSYAWQQIQRDGTTVLFGYGLGSRTSSAGLGIMGRTLREDIYGELGESGLGTFIQEYGVVGLALFTLINLWIVVKLFLHARKTTDPMLAALEYGLILFTLFWPMWLWYHRPWAAGVMMVLYWVSLGYAFRQIYPRRRAARPALSAPGVDPGPAPTTRRLP